MTEPPTHAPLDDGSLAGFQGVLSSAAARRLVALGGFLVYRSDFATGTVVVYGPLLEDWGYDSASVPAQSAWWSAQVHPEDREMVEATRANAIEGQSERWSVTYRFRRADGTWADVERRATLIRGADGTPIGSEGILQDVTERRIAERELRANEQQFRFLTENSREIVCRHDPDGRYSYVSPSIREFTGWSSADLVGRSPYEFFHQDDQQRIREESHDLALRGGFSGGGITYRFKKSDGGFVWLETLSRPILAEDGSVLEIVTTSRDVTDRRQVEAERLQTQKMELLTRVAAGIAHAFNNRLAVVQATAEMLYADVADAEHRARLDEIIDAAGESAALVRQMLTFTKQEFVQPDVVDLGALCEQMRPMTERTLGSAITLSVEAAEGSWARGDSAHVEQVLLNLVQNARAAMPEGGRVLVRAETVVLLEPLLHARGEVPTGTWRRLRVVDEGTGMPPEVLSRAAEPFFSTRPGGVGSGLGLATVERILAAWSGHLVLTSAAGLGTTVDCLLPAAEAPAAPAISLVPASPARGHVLLVEDEPIVRTVARRVLLRAGYTVVEAEDGASALRILETAPHPDLVLTDVVMPRMSGRELGDAISARAWAIPVLYMSGYSADELLRQGLLDRARTVVGKPFSVAALLDAVRAALRASA